MGNWWDTLAPARYWTTRPATSMLSARDTQQQHCEKQAFSCTHCKPVVLKLELEIWRSTLKGRKPPSVLGDRWSIPKNLIGTSLLVTKVNLDPHEGTEREPLWFHFVNSPLVPLQHFSLVFIWRNFHYIVLVLIHQFLVFILFSPAKKGLCRTFALFFVPTSDGSGPGGKLSVW